MIKKIIGIATIFLVVLCIMPKYGRAQTSSERIESFEVMALVNPDSTVNVQEKIIYNFAGNSRHGIFRNIPIKYNTSLGNQSVALKNISVKDESGAPYTFTTSKDGNDLVIKIGDEDTFVSGVKAYVIGYTVERSIGYFENYDEWYWNATGNGWDVWIERARAVVILPASLTDTKNLKTSCYRGVQGSTTACEESATSLVNGTVQTQFATVALNSHEGLTFAVGFPKGIVKQPTQAEKILTLVKDNWIIALPFVVFIFMFNLWWRKGKDPKGRGTIIPEYEAPDKLTPLEISAVLNQKVRPQDIPAEIIYLAEKGYLKINRLEEKGLVFSSTDYSIEKLKDFNDLPNEYDRDLLHGLFASDTSQWAMTRNLLNAFRSEKKGSMGGTSSEEIKSVVKLSDLKNVFYTTIPPLKKKVMAAVIAKGYYPTNPEIVIGKYVGTAVLFFIAVWVLAGLDMINAVNVGSLVASGVIVLLFGLLMPKVTELGAIARERIKGLKMYIETAEKDRINFHNAPEKNPELFEKLLPYAMVLELEKEWAKQFEGILMTPPSWYNDPSGRAFNAVILTNSLSSFSSSATTNLSSAPGGHSGSGGGGFSGGGGGGGGGGSW
ncbi:MAG: hypothetical protein K0S38_426 [Candidatus Paceibacter sp.]|jgi:uncharacterized membrane protein YgcG|nr:hypothetical protein [Candidatus Paceibacter sp.]